MKKLTIALLCGGISSEREVSLNSGQQVFSALDNGKYDVRRYDPKSDLPRLMADAPEIDAALVILHGAFGEDGTIQGLLDLLGIPYQGSGVLGSAVAMNKLAAKQLYERAGLPIPAYTVLRRGDRLDAAEMERRFGLPLVIKPVAGGSSIGMSIAATPESIAAALDLALAHDSAAIVETHIAGIEITAAVLGNDDLEALLLIEIIPGAEHPFFDYHAKYTAGASREICPARIDEALTAKAQGYAMAAHRALFCRGCSRTDMMLKDRELYLLETNTIPGMTATSLLPQAARVAGMSFGQLLDRMIALALEGRSGASLTTP